MAVTVSLYNHTAAKFADGSFAVGDTYKVLLLSANAGGFDATDTTKAEVLAAATEHSNVNGYTTGGATLANVAVTASGNDAKWDCDDVTWTATGGNIEAVAAVIYNDTDTNDPPVAYIDFGGTESAGDTTQFKLIFNAAGVFNLTVS